MHIHTNEDPKHDFIMYNAKEIIDEAKKKGFDIISITLNDEVIEEPSIKAYAKQKGIFLLRGVEKTIQGRHILLYGLSNSEIFNIKNFKDLKKIKQKKEILIVAAHPFYPNLFKKSCIGKTFFEHHELFDALEIQQVSSKIYDPNKKALRVAKKYNKSLIANSDLHFINYFGDNYTLINIKKKKFDEKDIIRAIKNKETELKINKLGLFKSAKLLSLFLFKK